MALGLPFRLTTTMGTVLKGVLNTIGISISELAGTLLFTLPACILGAVISCSQSPQTIVFLQTHEEV